MAFEVKVSGDLASRVISGVLQAKRSQPSASVAAVPAPVDPDFPEYLGSLPAGLMHAGKMLALGLYLKKSRDIERFGRADLRPLFLSAGWLEPRNWYREVRLGVGKGFLQEKEGTFSVTQEGARQAALRYPALRFAARAKHW